MLPLLCLLLLMIAALGALHAQQRRTIREQRQRIAALDLDLQALRRDLAHLPGVEDVARRGRISQHINQN